MTGAKKLKAALVAAHEARWVLPLLHYTPEKEARRVRRALDAARRARFLLRRAGPGALAAILTSELTPEIRELVILSLDKS